MYYITVLHGKECLTYMDWAILGKTYKLISILLLSPDVYRENTCKNKRLPDPDLQITNLAYCKRKKNM